MKADIKNDFPTVQIHHCGLDWISR